MLVDKLALYVKLPGCLFLWSAKSWKQKCEAPCDQASCVRPRPGDLWGAAVNIKGAAVNIKGAAVNIKGAAMENSEEEMAVSISAVGLVAYVCCTVTFILLVCLLFFLGLTPTQRWGANINKTKCFRLRLSMKHVLSLRERAWSLTESLILRLKELERELCVIQTERHCDFLSSWRSKKHILSSGNMLSITWCSGKKLGILF